MMESVTDVLKSIQNMFGDDGLRAIAAFSYSLGSDAVIRLSDETWYPMDMVMQECWSLGGADLK